MNHIEILSQPKSQPNTNGDITKWFRIFCITFLLAHKAHIDTCRRLAISCVSVSISTWNHSSLQKHRVAITMLVSSCSFIASYAHTAHRTSFKLIPGVLVLLSLAPSTIVCVYLGPANLYSIILMIITVIIISFHFIYSFKFYIIFNLHQHISHTHIWARTFCASYFSFPLLRNLFICFPHKGSTFLRLHTPLRFSHYWKESDDVKVRTRIRISKE